MRRRRGWRCPSLGVRSALVGQENYVVINIGNEPIGNVNAFNTGEVDHETILAEAQRRGLGYLAWS